MTVNARSFICADEMFICINHGAIMKIYDFYYKMWTSTLLFPNIGKCEQIDTLIMGEPSVGANGVRYQTNPLDGERQKYAEFMANIAVCFIILHEIGHLYNGHISYLKDRRGLSFLNMLPQNSVDYDLEKCVLELDADSTAIRLLIMFDYITNISGYGLPYDETMYLFITSISILFRFFYISTPNPDSVSNYLPIPFRLQTVYDELMRFRKIINESGRSAPIFFPDKSEDELSDFFSSAEDDVTYIIQDVFGKGNEQFVDSFYDENNLSLYLKVRELWGGLSDELVNYNLMPINNDYSV
jgi:hypothetical protein